MALGLGMSALVDLELILCLLERRTGYKRQNNKKPRRWNELQMVEVVGWLIAAD